MSAYSDLKERAEELRDDVCTSFPHLVCSETQGLPWDAWCEPCMARAVLAILPATDPTGDNGHEAPSHN